MTTPAILAAADREKKMRKTLFTIMAVVFCIGAKNWQQAAVGGLFAIAAALVRTEPVA